MNTSAYPESTLRHLVKSFCLLPSAHAITTARIWMHTGPAQVGWSLMAVMLQNLRLLELM